MSTNLSTNIEPQIQLSSNEQLGDQFLQSSLQTAVSAKNFALCRRLIVEDRADVNAQDKWGWTPLHTAVQANWVAGYSLFVENGALVNASTAHSLPFLSSNFLAGISPLQVAIQNGRSEAARFLLENGAIVKPQDKKGLSSLVPIAIRDGRLDTVCCLVQESTYAKTLALNHSLSIAVRTGRYDRIEYLLENGAQINEKNDKGLTPIEVAILNDCGTDMLRFLIDEGALIGCYSWGRQMNRIKKYLLQKGLSENNVIWFVYQKCPKLHALEVFQDGAFHSFSKVKRVAFTQPIALFNVAAYEDFGPNYGAIGQEFLVPWKGVSLSALSLPYLSFYKKVAEKFTVVRVRVEDPNQFLPIVRKVREAFSGQQLLHWSLHAHGCIADMQLGKTTTFHWKEHGPIVRAIGAEMAPLGATIGLLGCEVALSRPNSSNLCQVMSKWAPKQVVCGAPHGTTGMLPIVLDVPALNSHALLPMYTAPKGAPSLMKAYKAGELIFDGYLLRSRI